MKQYTSTLQKLVAWALPIQVGWAVLSSIWNIVGVARISQGLQGLGPTASPVTAVILLALAAALIWTEKRFPVVYLLLSLLSIFGAISAVIVAFTADPASWPTAFWRWAGAVLNGAGMLAAGMAVVGFFLRRTSR